MGQTAFTSIEELGPVPKLLEATGGSRLLERVFRSEGVPLGLAFGGEAWIPTRSLAGLFERSAREVGDDLFGFHLGELMQPEDFGPWMQYALSASDLCTFIRRTIRALRYHESGTALGLEISGKLARWVYQVQEPISLGRRHYSGLALWPMLVAVRRYLGANWTPVRVECDDDCLSWRNKFEERFGAPVVMGSAANAIVFESHLLKSAAILRTPLSDRVTFADLRRLASQRPPRTIPEAVRELVRIRMREPLTDMEGAAFLLGVSARTLQRQLGEAGVTYRDLVEQVRMERALHLISEFLGLRH